ncbi:NUDIX domain-containing protein [Kineosporia sp. A_224]|uniref:NUDIX hydrolase n=1 Tax=Kineosporia sp. A_224 TaxID=1962180 RepID=UPI0018EA20AD|nr:NUDIX domain-containing protein [Kineosporia sp. A_224]
MTEVSGTVVAATWVSRRADGAVLGVRPHGAGAFFLPGGVPEEGETYAEAAAREVFEETGIVVDAGALREVARVTGPAYGRPGWAVLLVCFEGPGVGEPVAGPDEIAEVAWIGVHEHDRFADAVRTALGLGC